ncbi:MAG: PIN domain-containing protein [Spirochaetales bacterium]|nr:PIN domain-containing protein [Spirochaetales bacterium]
MEKIFIDTNVIVYANDKGNTEKQKKALEVVTRLMESGEGVISTQVMQEYAYTAVKKLRQNHQVILRQLKLLEHFEVIRQSPDMIRRALEIMTTYGIGFWDACIIGNAEGANCSVIYSEDLNAGQYYSGIKVANPFFE